MAEAYNSSTYDGLPLLDQAAGRFDAKGGNEVVKRLGAIFEKHQTERVFGLVLNHRHFSMEKDERLIEYRGISAPWTKMLDKSRPSTWYVSAQNECSPYEFEYCTDGMANEVDFEPGNPKYRPFIESINEILRESDLVEAFGLCRYPGDDYPGRVEATQGRVNINFHPDDAPRFQSSREAAWFFSNKLKDGKCACICGGDGHTTATHNGHVATR
ncbi:hypothetical protein EJ07DRAFT_173806 [Lizonia empirigonia]|nr:hypothetical protein EJ07DRAFT_173806 [Lizonia empirigonia]